MNRTTCSRAALALTLVVVAASGCRCDSFRFYEVIRTFNEECNILPQGEFCDDEVDTLPPPLFEIWAVERAEQIRVTVDEEVWIATEINPENPDQLGSSKRADSTSDPGPCTTATERGFVIIADDVGLTGTIDEKVVVTGADDCGETPRGERSSADLEGCTVCTDETGVPRQVTP